MGFYAYRMLLLFPYMMFPIVFSHERIQRMRWFFWHLVSSSLPCFSAVTDMSVPYRLITTPMSGAAGYEYFKSLYGDMAGEEQHTIKAQRRLFGDAHRFLCLSIP